MHQTHPQFDNHEVCISRSPLDNPLPLHTKLIPSLGMGDHKTWSSQIRIRNYIYDKIEQSYQEDLSLIHI